MFQLQQATEFGSFSHVALELRIEEEGMEFASKTKESCCGHVCVRNVPDGSLERVTV